MKTATTLLASLMMAAVTTVSSAAPPAAPHVTEVIVLDVGTHMQKLLELSRRMDAIQAKYQATGKARLWRAGWAGAEAGRVIIAVEYTSLRALADSEDKTRGAPEIAALIGELDASGIKILSESLVTEIPR